MFFKALLKKYSMHIAEIYQITASITSDGGYSAFERWSKAEIYLALTKRWHLLVDVAEQ